MTQEDLEQRAELIALGNYLVDYPDDLSFDQIIDLLIDGDSQDVYEKIVVWEPFERYTAVDLARYIEDLKSNVMWRFSS